MLYNVRSLSICFLLFVCAPICSLAQHEDAKARAILERYLKMPHTHFATKTSRADSEADRKDNEARLARQAVLVEFKAAPNGAVAAAEEVLFEKASPEQRQEIVGALGGPGLQETAGKRSSAPARE